MLLPLHQHDAVGNNVTATLTGFAINGPCLHSYQARLEFPLSETEMELVETARCSKSTPERKRQRRPGGDFSACTSFVT